ncbi:MAG: radical SAM protein [Bacteroidetes bacterium]|nr:radical SAM protein [Bacteroidota bacterium]
MLKYFNIERLEFLVTKKCSGGCKHCSVIIDEGVLDNSFIDFDIIKQFIEFISINFNIKSIMTYGGEPLLYPEITANIHEIGKNCGIKNREIITNGYFTNNEDLIRVTVKKIIESGVNEILLSVDAFHQEIIKINYVEIFIKNVISFKFENIKIHPSWVVSEESDNFYNNKTRNIIESISKYGIKTSKGNNIVPSGLAKKYLKKYYEKGDIDFSSHCGESKFSNSPYDVKSLRVQPNGNINICRGLVIGNVFNEKIDDILLRYNPENNNIISILSNQGPIGLFHFLEENGEKINIEHYYNSCDLCTDCIKKINKLI